MSLRGRVSALTIFGACAIAGQAGDKVRQPVPPASDLAKLESTVQDVDKTQFAKRDDADRSALGKRLLRDANDATNDVATKFVLLRDAGDVALAAGDVPTALAALDARGDEFDENINDLRLSFLSLAAKRAGDPRLAAGVTDVGLRWLDEAATAEDYEFALCKLAPLLESEATRSHDRALSAKCQQRIKEIRALKDEFGRAQSAMKTLEEKPEDPAANSAVGAYVCFSKGDFAKGLPMLAKGSDSALAMLASNDLAGADGLEAKLKLGDSWAEFGTKHRNIYRGSMRRAQFWYVSALKDAKGLMRARVMKKLTILPAEPDFDLLAQVWGETSTTEVSGGANGPADDVPETPGFLVGFDYTTSPWEGRFKIVVIRPIFLTVGGKSHGNWHGPAPKDEAAQVVEAKQGYAVGGISVQSGDRVYGILVRFMRIHGSVLDPNDFYDGSWIGSSLPTTKSKEFGGDGRTVIGGHFLSGGDFEGIGLIQLK